MRVRSDGRRGPAPRKVACATCGVLIAPAACKLCDSCAVALPMPLPFVLRSGA